MKQRMSLNCETYRSSAGAVLWTNDQMLALLPHLHADLLRFFGGTCSSYVNWRTGQFVASGNANEGIMKGNPKPGVPVSGFMHACSIAGAQPLHLLNMCTEPDGSWVNNKAAITRQVQDQLTMLQSVHQPTDDVVVELGNELYLMGDPAARACFPQPADYVNSAIQFATAIKQAFSNAEIWACSLADFYKAIRPTWRLTVEGSKELSALVDGYTYHHYLPIPEAPTATNTDLLVADAIADWDHALGSTLATMPAGKFAGFTEFNYDNNSPLAAQMANTPTHGLVMAALVAHQLRDPRVGISGPHAVMGTSGVYPAVMDGPGGPALSAYGTAYGAASVTFHAV